MYRVIIDLKNVVKRFLNLKRKRFFSSLTCNFSDLSVNVTEIWQLDLEVKDEDILWTVKLVSIQSDESQTYIQDST